MDVSGQPPTSRRDSLSPRRHRWGLALLVGALTLLVALTLQLCFLPGSGTVYGAPDTSSNTFNTSNISHAPNAPMVDSPTATPSTTATAAAIPPTLTIAVPSSGQGPVGAHITITGSNWGASDVLVGAAAPGASCANQGGWSQTFGQVRPGSGQSIVYAFDWPTSLGGSGTAYSICAANSVGTATAIYQVVTSTPPSLTVDPLTTNAGSLVKVTGASFVGSGDVTLSVTDGQGKTRVLTTLSPDSSGAFSLTYQPRPTDVGDEVLHAATSASAPQGMRPALQADAKLHVGAALTPTPEESPTAQIVAPVTPSNGGGSTKTVLLVALVIGFLLAAAAVGGAIFYFVMRNRRRPDDGTGYQPAYGRGGNPGYGASGVYGAQFGDPYQDNGYTGYDPGMGGAGTGGWDTTTQGYAPQPGYSDEPDPNWRGRPMTGQWRASQDYDDAPYDNRGNYGNYGSDDSGQYPPGDPWGAPDASYGQPGQPYGTGQRPSGSRGGYDPDYPGYPPQSPPDPNGWGGSRGNPNAGRYPPSGPRSRGSGGGSRGSGGGASGGSDRSSQEWFPERRSDDDW